MSLGVVMAVLAESIVTTSPTPSDPIALTVTDRLGVHRVDEMVCSGVPFARGMLTPDQALHVETPDGLAEALVARFNTEPLMAQRVGDDEHVMVEAGAGHRASLGADSG